jgi:hypothetical protein
MKLTRTFAPVLRIFSRKLLGKRIFSRKIPQKHISSRKILQKQNIFAEICQKLLTSKYFHKDGSFFTVADKFCLFCTTFFLIFANILAKIFPKLIFAKLFVSPPRPPHINNFHMTFMTMRNFRPGIVPFISCLKIKVR